MMAKTKQKAAIKIITGLSNLSSFVFLSGKIISAMNNTKKEKSKSILGILTCFKSEICPKPYNPTIPPKTRVASCHSLALKNIQAIFTKLNVINHASILFNLKFSFCQSLWMISASACKKPQKMKVQPAPCQRPPSKNVINKFAYSLPPPPPVSTKWDINIVF